MEKSASTIPQGAGRKKEAELTAWKSLRDEAATAQDNEDNQ